MLEIGLGPELELGSAETWGATKLPAAGGTTGGWASAKSLKSLVEGVVGGMAGVVLTCGETAAAVASLASGVANGGGVAGLGSGWGVTGLGGRTVGLDRGTGGLGRIGAGLEDMAGAVVALATGVANGGSATEGGGGTVAELSPMKPASLGSAVN